jgi:carbon-monoxide dehydrogenase large subunit
MSQSQGIGAPVRRREDHRFLTGESCFTDDIALAGALHAVVVRSPHAHARIEGIDIAAARAAPGVHLVLTAADVRDEILQPIPSFSQTPPFDVRGRDGKLAPDASQYPLASAKVRYAGEPVAFVVAETLAEARDAAELVEIDYQPLLAAIDFAAVLEPDAPRVWDELASNVSFDWEKGNAAAVAEAMGSAAHVTRRELVNNRVVVSFMEPRAALAEFDAVSGRLTLHVGCQTAHGMQAVLAGMLGLDAADLRVVVPDTGGGFGARGLVYPEYALVLVAARRLGRPVRWTAERGESFLSDAQARDHILRGELALDGEGRFTALRVSIDWRHGAYLASRNVWVMVRFLPPTLGGVYRIPHAYIEMKGLFSNTTPQAAYRGIGRMEATYLIESLVDAAARETGIDRVELRRRNLVGPDSMPWTAPGGAVYTSGEFGPNLESALELADWPGFAARRADSDDRGLLRGIGLAMYVENDGGVPQEYAEVAAAADGTVTVSVGTQDFGMGHETMYAQVLADELGIPFGSVRVVFGDTDKVARGAGSHGSRSARIGGGATVMGAAKMIERGKELAAEMLEAAAADLEYSGGRFTIAGTDRSLGLAEVAGFAEGRGERLAASADFVTENEAHSNGCHVCEVTIDPDDGAVRIERYALVADVGRVLNPLIVHGQLHGGAVQGIGQALMERVVYDGASGQPLSGSYMDYALPRADELPNLAVALNEVIEVDNPLGVKGAGEGATTAAPAAVMNAIRDALGRAGVEHFDMPATPNRIWRALEAARAVERES